MKTSPYRVARAAAEYDRLAVPIQFAAPANDLVKRLNLAAGARVLDVGAGTGAATVPATTVVGPTGFVIGADAAPEMLQVLRNKGPYHAVAAEAPRLPFGDCAFDAVLASFVVTHFKDYRDGLADMVRVLRPGGRLGLTTWGNSPNPAAQCWTNVAGRFVNTDELKEAFESAIPWADWFSNDANLRSGRYETFPRQFPDGIEYVRDVCLAVATRPQNLGAASYLPRPPAACGGTGL
jgi:ubiquinone/menaquinone biosynthesis C-methylase UbiE